MTQLVSREFSSASLLEGVALVNSGAGMTDLDEKTDAELLKELQELEARARRVHAGVCVQEMDMAGVARALPTPCRTMDPPPVATAADAEAAEAETVPGDLPEVPCRVSDVASVRLAMLAVLCLQLSPKLMLMTTTFAPSTGTKPWTTGTSMDSLRRCRRGRVHASENV